MSISPSAPRGKKHWTYVVETFLGSFFTCLALMWYFRTLSEKCSFHSPKDFSTRHDRSLEIQRSSFLFGFWDHNRDHNSKRIVRLLFIEHQDTWCEMQSL